jgi:hypothetical protein
MSMRGKTLARQPGPGSAAFEFDQVSEPESRRRKQSATRAASFSFCLGQGTSNFPTMSQSMLYLPRSRSAAIKNLQAVAVSGGRRPASLAVCRSALSRRRDHRGPLLAIRLAIRRSQGAGARADPRNRCDQDLDEALRHRSLQGGLHGPGQSQGVFGSPRLRSALSHERLQQRRAA